MTFQYLTLDTIDTVKKKGGFIDQKTFKTAGNPLPADSFSR